MVSSMQAKTIKIRNILLVLITLLSFTSIAGVCSRLLADTPVGEVTAKLADYCPSPGGTTDATACMQKALDFLHSKGGGSLLLPDVQACYVVDHVQVYSHITILSSSQKTCIQRRGGPASGISSVFYSAVDTPIEDVHFRNFTIDGNRDHVTGKIGGTIGIDLFGPSDSSIEMMIIKNAYVDGIYIDCAGSKRSIPGNGITISHTRVTNSQRNNISLICGKNVHVEDSELSFASGAKPEAGIDVEENSDGQSVPGFSLVRTNIHHNHQEGILLIPAHDAAGSLDAILRDNDVHDNGSYGLKAMDFTHSNGIEVSGGKYVNNGTAGIILSGWKTSKISGEVIYGSNVGLSIANSAPDVQIGPGFLSGAVYDLEIIGPFSNGIMSGVILDHNVVQGGKNVTGFSSIPLASTGKCIPNRTTSKTAQTGCASGLISPSSAGMRESPVLSDLVRGGFARTKPRPQSDIHPAPPK